MKLTSLTCEYKNCPIAIDEAKPRFSWMLEDAGSAMQKWRRIVVRDGDKVVWDSGKVEAGDSVLIAYDGDALLPRTHYVWEVEVGLDNDATVKAESCFETGLMDVGFAESKWIGAESGQGNRRYSVRLSSSFNIEKPVAKARLYASALGLYVPYINGKTITDCRLMPGWTQYERHVQYKGFDVTDALTQGRNAIAALLGDGWFCGTISYVAIPIGEYGWGRSPLFRAELHIDYEDGTSEIIGTDEKWHTYSLFVSTLENDIYHGEEYDASFDDNTWKMDKGDFASVFTREWCGDIVWQSGEDVKVTRTIKPVSIKKRPSGVWLLDFGENIVGVERLSIKGAHPGAVISVRHGEVLDQDGDLWIQNLAFARQRTTLICGKEPIVYTPQFTYYGFRYIEVSGWPEEMTDSSVTVEVLSSVNDRTGNFESSNALLNAFYASVHRGQQGNFVDVPTDCPQRCERFGWTGDAQVFSETAMLNYDCGAFFTKWIKDLYFVGERNGSFPVIAPYQPGKEAIEKRLAGEVPELKPFNSSAGWADAGIVVPWNLYKCYGDKRILEKCYDHAILYVRNLDAADVAIGTVGDHLAFDKMPSPFGANALRIVMIRMMEKWAAILGKDEDAAWCRECAARRLAKFQSEFLDDEGLPSVHSQGAFVFMIAYDLSPTKDAREKAAKLLALDIEKRGIHLSTGFLSTPILLQALEESGQLELAYKLLLQTSMPSWLYPITQGATTTWERWDGIVDGKFHENWMNSFNHYAYGSVAAWFYRTICGIRPGEGEEAAGMKHFTIEPKPCKELDYAKCTLRTPYGLVKSEWRREDDGAMIYEISVPCNAKATIKLPGVEPFESLSGDNLTYCVSAPKA